MNESILMSTECRGRMRMRVRQIYACVVWDFGWGSGAGDQFSEKAERGGGGGSFSISAVGRVPGIERPVPSC